MSTTQTLLNDVQQGVPSGNYDGSSLDFASDAAAGPGYYQGNAGTQTVAVRVANFDGRIQLQGTLDCLPGDGTNWVSLAEFDTSDSAATYTEIVTVTGQFVWIRARVLNFLDGTIDSVTSTYAGAGADIGGGSDATAGVFSSVTANAVYVGTTGVVSSGNITAPYFLGNGSQLTGVANLGSFSVQTQTASGNGALVYNSANGVFQFTPADAGASNYGNANVVAYAESGWAGNIVPATDDQYSLGNATNQWSELWVSNSTIYIGGVPVAITGNVLTVNGEPVLQNDSNSSITTTGNIAADYFIGNGSQLTGTVPLANVTTYVNIANVQGGSGSTYKIPFTALENGGVTQFEIDDIGPGLAFVPSSAQLITGNLRISNDIVAGDDSNIGTISANVFVATGNITAGNILTDNYRYANGEPFVSSSTGNITFSNTTMSPPDGEDITIAAASSEVAITGLDFRLEVTDDVRITGNDVVTIRNTSDVDSITIRTDYNGADRVWEFGADGTLFTPGDIQTRGDITGDSGTSTLVLAAEPNSNTAIQLNDSVDSIINTVANLEISTNVSNTVKTWTFDTTGNLTAPGNMRATSYRNASGDPILGDYVFANNTIQTDNGDGGITLSIFGPDQAAPPALIEKAWLFGNTGAFYSPGNVVAPNFVGNGLFNGTTGIAIPTANSNIYVGFGLVGSIEFNAEGVTALNLAATGNVTGARANISGNVTAGNILTDNYRYANGEPFVSSSTGNLEITGTMIEFAAGATEELITVSPDGFAGQAVLQLPNNATANVYDTILTNSGGNVKISTGNGVAVYDWLFDAAGNLTAPGNITTTGNISANTAGFAIGYRDIPQVSFTGNATMAAADAGKHFYSTESTDYVLTIADNSAVSWPVGTAITVVNRGTGNITVAQASGVSLYLAGNATAGNRVVTTYGMVTVLNVAANVWMINGTGVN